MRCHRWPTRSGMGPAPDSLPTIEVRCVLSVAAETCGCHVATHSDAAAASVDPGFPDRGEPRASVCPRAAPMVSASDARGIVPEATAPTDAWPAATSLRLGCSSRGRLRPPLARARASRRGASSGALLDPPLRVAHRPEPRRRLGKWAAATKIGSSGGSVGARRLSGGRRSSRSTPRDARPARRVRASLAAGARAGGAFGCPSCPPCA